MNFYTSTSKLSAKKWVRYAFFLPISYITIVFSFNYIIDPYELTSFNLLKIKEKMTRNDRIDKIVAIQKYDQVQTLIIGSSRTYNIDPDTLGKYFNTTSNYNFGIGGSQSEDHLGVLLYLEKIKKLPKNILLAIDFNSFNPNIPVNEYFLKSKELNFLNKNPNKEDYLLKKYLTLDATRASFKTLKHHVRNDKVKSSFKKNGLRNSSDIAYENTSELKNDKENVFQNFYKNGNYPHIDQVRVFYVKKFIKLCEKHNINLIMYASSSYIENYKDIVVHPILSQRLTEFLDTFSEYENFYNQFTDDDFSKNNLNFTDRVHITTNAGDRLLKSIFSKISNKRKNNEI